MGCLGGVHGGVEGEGMVGSRVWVCSVWNTCECVCLCIATKVLCVFIKCKQPWKIMYTSSKNVLWSLSRSASLSLSIQTLWTHFHCTHTPSPAPPPVVSVVFNATSYTSFSIVQIIYKRPPSSPVSSDTMELFPLYLNVSDSWKKCEQCVRTWENMWWNTKQFVN